REGSDSTAVAIELSAHDAAPSGSGAVPAAEAVTEGDVSGVLVSSPHVELAVVHCEGSDATSSNTSSVGSDGSPAVGGVPAAEVLTGGQAVDAGELAPDVELVVVHCDGVDTGGAGARDPRAAHIAPVRRANDPGAVQVVELGPDPVLVARHRGDPDLVECAIPRPIGRLSAQVQCITDICDRTICGAPAGYLGPVDVDEIFHRARIPVTGAPHPDHVLKRAFSKSITRRNQAIRSCSVLSGHLQLAISGGAA